MISLGKSDHPFRIVIQIERLPRGRTLGRPATPSASPRAESRMGSAADGHLSLRVCSAGRVLFFPASSTGVFGLAPSTKKKSPPILRLFAEKSEPELLIGGINSPVATSEDLFLSLATI